MMQNSTFQTENMALVLEGGGMRTIFTVGVLDCFLDNNIHFPYMVCVSGGTSNGLSYKSKQRGRALYSNTTLLTERPYIGIKTLLKKGRFIDMEFLFGEFTHKFYPFDFETFFNSPTRFEIVTTDCETGKARYWEETKDSERLIKIAKASASLPMISPTVEIEGMTLSDGGMADSIPLERAFSQGFGKALVVLSQNKGFRKKTSRFRIPTWLSGYKHMSDLLYTRPERYNAQLEWVEQLEAEGKILVLRPEKPLKVSRLSKNVDDLQELYDEGYALALQLITENKQRLGNE